MKPLLDYLFQLERKGIKVGLVHTRELLKRCGDPQKHFRIIHVAGTNGKGSTCSMIASILRECGFSVGLYTSPHLVRFNERIRVDGVPISDRNIIEFVDAHKTDIEEIESTFFETTTAMAFDYFNSQNVDVAVVETGLGGRLDSTNVVSPQVTVITPIGIDHTEFLGDSLKQISREKAGIIKKSVPLVLSEQDSEAENVILKKAKQKSVSVNRVFNKDFTSISTYPNGAEFIFQDKRYFTPLLGDHQVMNAGLAIQAVRVFDKTVLQDEINTGLKKTIWPGRIQPLDKILPIFYDVAHNCHGIHFVLSWLNKHYSEKPIGVFVLKADKELGKMRSVLADGFSELIITSLPEVGLMSVDALELSMQKNNIEHLREDSLGAAVYAMKRAVSEEKPGLIFGSHYIGKAVYDLFEFSFDKGII
ncbi:MAG: bifunctional folylpolyglutamate synthase/dihydrofolate synthase [Candidatus Marinimicrobia bacterium]|nr:bifunctional folylpolyglutamate synthase/dihydrofolate synthase [Candidatus Neomarinimicrobiota bacterium]